MSDHLFTWAVGGSIGTHVVVLSMMAALGFWTATATPPASVPIEIIPATPEAPPPPPPKLEPVKPPKRFTEPRPAAPAPAPVQPSMLIDDKTALETPAPAASTPEPKQLPTNAMISNPNAAIPGLREGGAAGAGGLFSTGDMSVQAGPGTSGGSGASGRAGSGLALTGTADAAAAAGVTSFAKPLGGYQTLPRYPESARRAGIEGVTMLRFLVLANGRVGGMSFGAHVDNAIRQITGTPFRIRTDLAATLFLSRPEEYDGGELVVEDTYGAHAVKLPAGDMILYPATSLHRVIPVTRGVRFASFLWIQSMVRDDPHRALLFDLDMAINQVNQAVPNHPAVVALTSCYHNLLRSWSDS